MNRLIAGAVGVIVGCLVIAAAVGGFVVRQETALSQSSGNESETVTELEGAAGSEGVAVPYYFIAIHNEPNHVPEGRQLIEASYLVLKEMIEKANQYNIKITLMFTPQWADYISESPQRMADLESWKQQGHEIAAHHHSIYHGNWDGYTDYSEEEAMAKRVRRGGLVEPYLGTLTDYINKLKKINPKIHSGGVNDEPDKRCMPDEIIYDTCSGFANHGDPGRREGDGATPEKGKNEYVTVGTCQDIQRRWLTHYQITTPDKQDAARAVFHSMDSGVYGVVAHSVQSDAEEYYKFLEFLNSKDPTGVKSRTVTEVIEQGLIPERTISSDTLYASPSTVFYFAEGSCRPGFDPYICIQNPREDDADVKITYMLGDGTTKEQAVTVP
ncbi:MAG: hypothetical protein KKE90_11760, partial [Actinobacteria bacterium]|nr:hypothetical protein [Actinomycetota bacterium]MBU4359919.1 hypothetical protein [Actinomycetota bacterium]MBU4441920.1 hypothetical protein [Actinomycetota bacterium]